MLCQCKLEKTCHRAHRNSTEVSSADRKTWAVAPASVQASTSAGTGKLCAGQLRGGGRIGGWAYWVQEGGMIGSTRKPYSISFPMPDPLSQMHSGLCQRFSRCRSELIHCCSWGFPWGKVTISPYLEDHSRLQNSPEGYSTSLTSPDVGKFQ